MKNRKNAVHLFLEKSGRVADKVAILSEDFQLTFGELSSLVLNYGAHFRRRGLTRESTMQVRSDDPVVVIASALAAGLIGCRWVFGGAAGLEGHIGEVTHRFQTELDAQVAEGKAGLIDPSWSAPPQLFNPEVDFRFEGFGDDDDTWLVFPSSGTTGTPKFMCMSHAIISDRSAANAVEFPTGEEVAVFLFTIHSPPSLMRALCALSCGASLVFSLDPEFWLRAGVTHVFASPAQIRNVLPDTPLPRKIGKALIGGDGLPDTLTRRLLQSFEMVVNTYGSTEANLVVENERYLTPDGSLKSRTIWHDSEVGIVDENDTPVAPGEEGTIRVRNGYLAPGYLNNPVAEAAAFRDGWFYPGDLGRLAADGSLIITGRSDDIFNLGGVKLNATVLDFMLQSVDGVEDAISFQVPDEDGISELVALIKSSPDAIEPEISSAARIKIALEISPEAVPSRFLYTDAIPRSENGKPDRAACIRIAQERRKAFGGPASGLAQPRG